MSEDPSPVRSGDERSAEGQTGMEKSSDQDGASGSSEG